MNKKICSVLSGLMLVGISATAVADKPPKAEVYHCGCVTVDEQTATATAELQWKLLSISTKSKGHRNHEADDLKICMYVDENLAAQSIELERGFDDCEPIGNDLLLGVGQCGVVSPVPTDSCEEV